MLSFRGRPFLEVLAAALHEDYRFPILEIFAFLYVLSAFAFSSFGITTASSTASSATIAYQLITALLNLPLLIFVFLIFKNIAYGLGNDLEKGIIQTYLSYPIKRKRILSAKLVSALGVAVVLLLVFQLLALSILAPDIVLSNIGTILLTYASALSYPLLIAGFVLLLTFYFRRGSISLVVGIILSFALSIASGIVSSAAYATKSVLLLQVFSIISPQTALSAYYGNMASMGFWTPTFSEISLSLLGSYAIVAFVFGVSYFYFCRRLSL